MDERVFFDGFMIAWVCLAAAIFAALHFVEAPYGKFTRAGFGPTVDRTLGWVVMETPAALGLPFFFLIGDRPLEPATAAFLALWELHYVQRTYVFPFLLRGDKRHMTLLTVVLGAVFNLCNGYLNGRYLFFLAPPYPADWLSDPRFVAGALVFLAGLGVNLRADAHLRSLRGPGETGYKIPTRGMFRYVSAANYLGELVEWAGFALLTWSPAALVFFVWTAANLAPRARSQHAFLRARFADYPPERKALIPFVW